MNLLRNPPFSTTRFAPLLALLPALFAQPALTSSPDDNITRITDRLDASKTLSFAYDEVSRLKRVTLAETSTAPMKRTDYVFDGNGNRTRILTRPLATDPPEAALTERYGLVAGSNRLASIRAPAASGSTGAIARQFTYDTRGNLTGETRPGGVTIMAGYDGYGRLTSYARTGDPSTGSGLTHVYNGMDDRVATTRSLPAGGSDTRRFVYAPDGRVLGEYGASATDVKAEFIWMSPMVGDSGAFGGDDGLGGYMPLAVASNDSQGTSQLSWVHASHMGVPIRYSDSSGATLTAPTSYSIPGFPGQSQTMADLYYNRYRDYDTSTGRYIQSDPIGLAGGPSPYSYALNNPIRFTDPLGLMTAWEYLTGTPDSYRVNIMNGIAGLSDSATFGATYQVRGWLGLNGEIDENCNDFYGYGEWGALALGGGAAVKYGGKSAYKALFERHGKGFFNRNDILRIGEGWSGPAIGGSNVFRSAFGHRSWPKIPGLPKFPWHITFWKW